MTTPALLPCPFCGGRVAPPLREGGSDERSGYNFVVSIVCKCGACIARASHRDFLGWCDDTGQAMAAVCDAWNTRAKGEP